MLLVKQELLAALAAGLEQLSPGAGGKAAFESPKVAAHGDLACTAAMQLAKPLKRNPRQVAEAAARPRCWPRRPSQRWVDAVEIAGPGFLNIRLKPAAKQQVVREVLAAGAALRPASRPTASACWWSSSRPTPPARCTSATAARRRWATPSATCTPPRAGTCYREFYYNDAGVQIQTLATSTQLRAKGFKPGDPQWPEAGLQRRLHPGHRRRLPGEEDREVRRPRVHRQRRRRRPRRRSASSPWPTCATSRTWTCRPSRCSFDNYYLESSLYTSGKVDAAVQQPAATPARPTSRTARCG